VEIADFTLSISQVGPKYRYVDEIPKIQILQKQDLFAKTPTISLLQIQFEYRKNFG
jgi:hypothetical protein